MSQPDSTHAHEEGTRDHQLQAQRCLLRFPPLFYPQRMALHRDTPPDIVVLILLVLPAMEDEKGIRCNSGTAPQR